MHTHEPLAVAIHATPEINPDYPRAAILTVATAVDRWRYSLTRDVLQDLGRMIDDELQHTPLPEADSQPSTESPFELKRRTLPRVRAEAGHVIVRLELTSLRYPSEKLDIEVLFAADIAAALGNELLDKAMRLA
jgi:hypothetical protein